MPAAVPARSEAPRFRFRTEVADLEDPVGVAVAADGTWYVVERGRHQVRAFDAAGQERFAFGGEGDTAGRLFRPHGIAVTPAGRLIVADTGNDRLQVFDARGTPLRTIGGFGLEPGRFHAPTWVAASDTALAVVEDGTQRVQLFTLQGEFVAVVGATAGAAITSPAGVAASGAHWLVSDRVQNRVHELDAGGDELRAFGDYGSYPGLMAAPAGLAVAGDHLFVADSQNHRVQIFARDGTPLAFLGKAEIRPYEGQGRLQIPADVAVARDASFLVVSETEARRCQVFEPDPTPPPEPVKGPPTPAQNPAEPHYETCLDVRDGTLAAIDMEFHRILLHDVTTTPVNRVGRAGDAGYRFGQFMRPRAVQVLAPDRLLVADSGNRRLQWLDLRTLQEAAAVAGDRGVFEAALDFTLVPLPAALRRAPIDPVAVEQTADGRVFVLDAAHEAVLVFRQDLTLHGWFGGHGTEPGRLRRPTDLAVDLAAGRVYVVDADNRRVQRLDLEGHCRDVFDRVGERAFVEPAGVALAPDGSVYVTDAGDDRVVHLDTTGAPVADWGGRGLGAGQFLRPRGVAVGADGRVFVLDQGNRRVQIFSADGQFLDVFGVGWYVRAARPSRQDEES